MINYFDKQIQKEYNLKMMQSPTHKKIWYLYDEQQNSIHVIKEIPFEDIQLYRALQYENNPNIVKVIDVARLGDKSFVELEYIQGITVETYIEYVEKTKKETPPEICLEIMLLICSALETCHTLGFVHRDISGNNVLLSVKNNDVCVHLIDFGNRHWIKEDAKQDTTVLGTVGYAAPEQWGFSASNPSTDIYACGILLCRLLTGKGREAVDTIELDLLKTIVKRCIRMEQDERYPNVYALQSDLWRAYSLLHKYKKTDQPMSAEAFQKFVETDSDVDYAKTFLEKPELEKTSLYVVFALAVIGAFILSHILEWVGLGPGTVFLLYFPFSLLAGGHFKGKLETQDFYYPYSQKFTDMKEKIHVALMANRIKCKSIEERELTVTIKKRKYYVTMDASKQALNIKADWEKQRPGIPSFMRMMKDVGLLVYLFQHLYAL